MLKRLISMLLSVMMLLALVGCGANNGADAEDGTSITAKSTLTEDELEALKDEKDLTVLREAISNVSDFTSYLRTANFSRAGNYSQAEELLMYGGSNQPHAYCWLFASVLEDNYSEVGIIEVYKEGVNHDFYTYLKINEAYHLLSPISTQNIIMNCQSTNLEELAAMCLEKAQINGPLDQYKITPIIQNPLKFEKSTLTEEELEALKVEKDLTVLREAISNVSDFASYLRAANFSREGNYSRCEELLLYGGSDQLQAYCWLMTAVLEDDYPEVGIIDVYQKDGNRPQYLYVKSGENYCPLDFFFSDRTIMEFKSTSLEEVGEFCLKASQANGPADKYEITRIMGYSGEMEAPNGVTVELTTDGGTETFHYAGTTLPLGLGLPRLTDAEIDALLASDDYEHIKETIDTVADMVNYFKRGKYTHACSEFIANDIGYTCSGAQTLLLRESCVSMCNSAVYCLKDDYDEMGYVYFSTLDDGHVMNYIKQDGIYYTYDAEICFVDNHPFRWMSNYGSSELIWASEDFQDLADSFAKSKMGDGEVKLVYSVQSDGDIVYYKTGPSEEAAWRKHIYRYYPEGTTATAWYGDPVIYYETDHDWQSQTAFYDPAVFNLW